LLGSGDSCSIIEVDVSIYVVENGDIMKAIHYDAEGDILTVTFSDVTEQKHTGIELSDNLVLYYNPETEQPLQLIVISYQALLQKRTAILHLQAAYRRFLHRMYYI
jgi:hypothetical protein